jgi:arginase
VERVVTVARQVAGEVAAIRAGRRLPLVQGGDGTITLGVLAGFDEAGLVYFDGDADLSTPERSESAVADTMGMTHLLGGGSPRLAGLGSRCPLLRAEQVVLFGFGTSPGSRWRRSARGLASSRAVRGSAGWSSPR